MMVAEGVVLGMKRTCPGCHVRFYDLERHPIVCPKCGTTFVPEAILPSRGDQGIGSSFSSHSAEKRHDIDEMDLEGIGDVDPEEEGDSEDLPSVEIDDDTTLLEEDDEYLEEAKGSVSGIIGGVKPSRSDDS